jgi:MarR family transcriptional regulator, organic hydroperoxide resistance regulator
MGSQIINSPGTGDSRRILDSLRAIIRELRLASASYEKALGLSAAQLFVLHALRDRGPCSLGELADCTETDPSSVSVVVQKLEEKRLLVKRASKEDRRRLEIRLTPAGRRLARAAPQPVQEGLIGRIYALSEAEKGQLAGLLERLALADLEPPPMFFEERPAAPEQEPSLPRRASP